MYQPVLLTLQTIGTLTGWCLNTLTTQNLFFFNSDICEYLCTPDS